MATRHLTAERQKPTSQPKPKPSNNKTQKFMLDVDMSQFF